MKRLRKPDFERTDLLPPRLEDWLPPHHPARFVRDFVASLDLADLGFQMPRGEQGGPVLDPTCLLSLWLFAWMERIRSLRQIERACLSSLPMLWLSGGLSPDKNTLWRFFLANRKPLRDLLVEQVRLAADAGMVGWALHALDGTKIPAASSNDSAWWRKKLEKQLKRIDEMTDAELARLEADVRDDQEPGFALPEELQSADARRAFIRRRLEARVAEMEEKKKAALHPLEPEANVVKGRGWSGLGYNPQILVDEQSDLIVSTEVTAEAGDVAQMVPRLEQLQQEQGRVADTTTMDRGYDSIEQLAAAEEKQLPVVVALVSHDTGPFAKPHFTFDPVADTYTCPQKRTLPLVGVFGPTKEHPFGRRLYQCDPEGCPVRAKCTKSKGGRSVYRYGKEESRERMAAKNQTPEATEQRRKRKLIVEHKFGQLKSNEGFRRFLRRGLENVRTEWALACCASNVWKLHRAWVKGLSKETRAA